MIKRMVKPEIQALHLKGVGSVDEVLQIKININRNVNKYFLMIL